jgi:hypothetical protein
MPRSKGSLNQKTILAQQAKLGKLEPSGQILKNRKGSKVVKINGMSEEQKLNGVKVLKNGEDHPSEEEDENLDDLANELDERGHG